MLKKNLSLGLAIIFGSLVVSCSSNDENPVTPVTPVVGKDINTATKVSVDRFSASFGHLFVRTAENKLPAANAAINCDTQPFITMGLDKDGKSVSYYNFDVQSTTPDDIYVFFKNGATTPIAGQNNIIPTIPGDSGYNDFWIVNKVIVPDNYVPNSITSEAEVLVSKFTITKTKTIVNCPVVPFGSTAAKSKDAGKASVLTIGWYQGKAVAYFSFEEATVTATDANKVPLSPIYVMFNDNVVGPPSGFKSETVNKSQTHNVIATSPGDAGYSPLWNVLVIDNANFDAVLNLTTAKSFTSKEAGATVNCPVIK